MDKFEYLPQLIVAYDSKDKFANLIHVKKADTYKDYYCPCCGGIVKPRALESTKEQYHYYHISGKCKKESQMHFFCKNWLFDTGSKFYIDEKLHEVDHIEIEKTWNTSFGDYRPDITVYTTDGTTLFFELFFANRKHGDDYFCKWSELGNDVIEINLKEYCNKVNFDEIPTFNYLFHDNKCYSKEYIKKDFYANTIAKRKTELSRQQILNYKARIEKLDWFWQTISNEHYDDIISAISSMEYDDMVFCYDIIKNKQCVKKYRNQVKDAINNIVLNNVRDFLELEQNENVYFGLLNVRGNMYEAGIILDIKRNNYTHYDIYEHCHNEPTFHHIKGFPKIKLHGDLLDIKDFDITEQMKLDLQRIYNDTLIRKEEIIRFFDELDRHKDYQFIVENDIVAVRLEVNGVWRSLESLHHQYNVNKILYIVNQFRSDVRENYEIENYINTDEVQKMISDFGKENGIDIFCLNYENDRELYCNRIGGKSFGKYSVTDKNISELLDVIHSDLQLSDELYDKAVKYSEIINSHNSSIFKAYADYYYKQAALRINLIDPETGKEICHNNILITDISANYDNSILITLKVLLNKSEVQHGIRFMEVR